MTQRRITIFTVESYSKLPKKKYSTNKTVFYCIDDTWSSDIIDLFDYIPENIRR